MGDNEVLAFIELLKITFGRYSDYSGGCYKFHLILKHIYGVNAIGYYNGEHVITKIHHQYYDVDGIVWGNISGKYLRIVEDGGDYTYNELNKLFKQYLS